MEFTDWWGAYGAPLFAYKLNPPRVDWIQSPEEMRSIKYNKWQRPLKVPMFLTKSEILAQLSQLLADHEPMPIPTDIASEHEVSDLRGIRRQVLFDAHRVWCLDHLLKQMASMGELEHPERYTQLWIGRKLGIVPVPEEGKYRSPTVQTNERLAVRVKVNRYLSKANIVISNVEIGNFPCLDPVDERKRWNKRQQKEMEAAIEAGAWDCPESSSKEFHDLFK